jgi:hypothetical protein
VSRNSANGIATVWVAVKDRVIFVPDRANVAARGRLLLVMPFARSANMMKMVNEARDSDVNGKLLM